MKKSSSSSTIATLLISAAALCLLIGFLLPQESAAAQWLKLAGGIFFVLYLLLTVIGWVAGKLPRRAAPNSRTVRCVSCGQMVTKPLNYNPYDRTTTLKCPHCGGRVGYF